MNVLSRVSLCGESSIIDGIEKAWYEAFLNRITADPAGVNTPGGVFFGEK